MIELPSDALDPTGHSSFSFYDFLPGEGFRVLGAPDANDAAAFAEGLLRRDLLDIPDAELDRFAALLLTHGQELPAEPCFAQLARATACGFASLLGNEVRRPRRMRLTRLSLMLRVILDREADVSDVREELFLPCKSPWDFLTDGVQADAGWAVSCDDDNLRRLELAAIRWSRRAGLPTQLDRLEDGIWVGSHYTNGGDLLRCPAGGAPRLEHVSHALPIPLAFDWDGRRWALDAGGTLWQLQGSRLERPLARLPGAVHRARVLGSTAYAFDWSVPGVCTQVDLDRLEVRRVTTGDIIVCNDVCSHAGMLYGICKLQGRVFKMDEEWSPLASRLGAGRGPGRLLDPIMIRSDENGLSVLNWFSAKLLRLSRF